MKKKVGTIQKLAWLYASGFIIVVLLGHIPGLTDAQGRLFGFYNVSPLIDSVHLLAGVLAVIAAWHSTRWAINYFKFIAIPFGLDAIISLLFNRDLTETGSIFTGIGAPNFTLTNLLSNLPHILLASVALWIGFSLSHKINADSKVSD